MFVSSRHAVGCFVLILAVLGSSTAPAAGPDSSATEGGDRDSTSHRPSNWQFGAGGAGTLHGSGWSAVATYERVLDPVKSLVVRGELCRVHEREAGRFTISYSIPEWSVSGSESIVLNPEAWVDSYALFIGGRASRSGRIVHPYIESGFGPALERVRGRTRVSAMVAAAGGALVQPARSAIGGFVELRGGFLFADSGVFFTGRAGLLLQRP